MAVRRSHPRGGDVGSPADARADARADTGAAAQLRPLQVASALNPATPTQMLIQPAGGDAPCSGRVPASCRNQSDIARFVNDRLSAGRPR